MKNILIVFFSLLLVGSCKKQEIVSQEVTVSYPVITLKGDKYISIPVGGSYTDAGASVFDDVNGSTTDLMADYSSLDVNTPGLYYMAYRAKNTNGYKSFAARYIAVTDYPDTVDIQGVYQRTSNGVTVNLTRVAKGLYMTDDMGGAAINDVAYFTLISDTEMDLGPQLSETLGSEIAGSDESIIINDADDVTYSYKLDAAGYGTAQRTFVKVGNLKQH